MLSKTFSSWLVALDNSVLSLYVSSMMSLTICKSSRKFCISVSITLPVSHWSSLTVGRFSYYEMETLVGTFGSENEFFLLTFLSLIRLDDRFVCNHELTSPIDKLVLFCSRKLLFISAPFTGKKLVWKLNEMFSDGIYVLPDMTIRSLCHISETKFRVGRGVRQGWHHLTLIMGSVFKKLEWSELGINIST